MFEPRHKRLSNKEKQEKARKQKAQKNERRNKRKQGPSDKARIDQVGQFLRFINDSDKTVQENKEASVIPFNIQNPKYVINQKVYLMESNAPSLPRRPLNPEKLSVEELHAEETEIFKQYFKQMSPDDQTIANDYCHFELNEDVYRWVWRVIERGDILVLLTDARFPICHTPINIFQLFSYVKKPFIVILNKCDLISNEQLQQWKEFYETLFKENQWNGHILYFSAAKDKEIESAQRPELPNRQEFIKQIVRLGRSLVKKYAPETITLSFLGQPSVGKSSMMNTLLNKKVTKVRITAGCTKHLQTYYLDESVFSGDSNFANEDSRSVLFCDCPGLVFPVKGALRPLQLITGVYPLGRAREFYSAVRLLGEQFPDTLTSIINQIKFDQINRKYNINLKKEDINSPASLLDAVAYQLNYITSKNTPWAHKAGIYLMTKIIEGQLVYEIPVSDSMDQIVESWKNLKNKYKSERNHVESSLKFLSDEQENQKQTSKNEAIEITIEDEQDEEGEEIEEYTDE